MMRLAGLVLVASGAAVGSAAADEIRHTAFMGTLIGTWAQSADQCDKGNKITVSPSSYSGPDGNCAVEVIVETPGSKGPNYSVRGRCTPPDQAQNQQTPHVVNVIMRPDSADQISIGSSFEDLKPYQRCPAKP